jgi:ATP-dependent protease Clp ATPase subunit
MLDVPFVDTTMYRNGYVGEDVEYLDTFAWLIMMLPKPKEESFY